MKWIEAITAVLTESGRSMHYTDIARTIIEKGYRADYGRSPENSVNSLLTRNPNLFESLGGGNYKLVETSVTEKIDWDFDAIDWDAIDVPDKPITGEVEGDSTPSRHKYASDFIYSSVLSELEMELLEVIVNFPLPLASGEVCFADVLDKLDVEILEEEESRSLSVDATILREKLSELKEQIADMVAKAEHNPNLRNENEYERKLGLMRSAAEEAEQRLREASGEKIEFNIPLFGKFVPGNKESKPKVVIYLKSIENNLKSYESRVSVMAGVFVHEMFHAWNYFIAGGRRSVLAIDEPMVEFATLYFLKELKAFTSSQSHSLEGNMSCVKLHREFRVQNKQESIGDVAAYGFGYYLFNNLSDDDSIKWIETYSKKSASISRDPQVKKVEEALIPVYPFKSEATVMKWFKKIIFSGQATLSTTGMSTATKVGLDVSLRDLVLACIKTIGRKCFDAQELYAFAPIFKVCLPECKNLESALKQQLDELVKEGHLDALRGDCYGMKLAGVYLKPKDPAPTPTLAPVTAKPKKAKSIPFAVKFLDDDLLIREKTAVETYIKSLKHIGLSNVQSAGIMKGGYNLVSDVEHPSNGEEQKFQDYVNSKYIYTKLGNEEKKGFLIQIAYKLGIKIEIYDI